MKRILLALSALAISTVAASAADLAAKTYTKAPPAPLPPPCIWCGFYIGLNGGWAGTTGSNNNLSAFSFDPDAPTVFATAFNTNQNTTGGFGGGQIGYNWMFPGGMSGPGAGWLVGVEADIQGASLRTGTSSLFFNGDFGTNGNLAVANSRLDWFGTLRGRFGYATGPVLFYGTGGLAYGNVRNNLLVDFQDDADCTIITGITPCGTSALVSNNNTRWGWVAGAGIEWMFLPNWSVKGEYQYIDLGSVTQTATTIVRDTTEAGLPEGITATRHVNEKFNTVRIGVNYHFGGPALGGY